MKRKRRPLRPPARSGKLQRRNHPSARAARTELASHGYLLIHTRPGAPEKWARGPEQLAIAREEKPRSILWHIVAYPMDANAMARPWPAGQTDLFAD